jgi:hypothetical protein
MMKSRYLAVAVVLAVVAIQPFHTPTPVVADTAAPLAVLMSCQGDVSVVKSDGHTVKGAFGMPLEAGDEVRTGKGAEADILFQNGNYISIGASSNMKVRGSKAAREKAEPSKPMGDNGFEVAQNFLKLKSSEGTSSIAGLRSGERGEELRAVSPRQTKVAGGHPVFTWNSGDPSTELELTLYDEDGVHWKHTVKGESKVAYPADAPGLVEGTTYSWTLETTDPLKIPPLRSKAAFFELIPVEERASLESSLDRIEKDGSLSPVSRHIMRASVFFNHGLLSSAVAETESAVELAPEDVSLQSILARLYNEVGRTAEAAEIYNRILDGE